MYVYSSVFFCLALVSTLLLLLVSMCLFLPTHTHYISFVFRLSFFSVSAVRPVTRDCSLLIFLFSPFFSVILRSDTLSFAFLNVLLRCPDLTD